MARIALKIKPVATSVEEDIELYGREGEDSEDESDDGFDASLLAIASAAEDELLLAQAKGTQAALTTKQKLAMRRKLKYELWYFIAFVIFFIWSVYARRTVKEAFRLQEAVSTAFTDEQFGDYNEKAFMDVANFEEACADGPHVGLGAVRVAAAHLRRGEQFRALQSLGEIAKRVLSLSARERGAAKVHEDHPRRL